MKTKIILCLLLLCSYPIFAQPWSTAGNTTGPGDFLGTINPQPINFFTAGIPKASLSVAGDYNLTIATRSYQIGGNNVLWHKGNTNNIFVGVNSGTANTTGTRNTFVGRNSGASNVGGVNNVFIGHDAGPANTGGSFNTFMGWRAGLSNIAGDRNVYLGYAAGASGTNSDRNTIVGALAGISNTTNGITLLGFSAGLSNTSGVGNTYLGHQAAAQGTTGGGNTAVGNNTGQEITTGNNNVFVGSGAARLNNIGSNNVVLGANACGNAITDQNVIIGRQAYGTSATINTGNVIIGDFASNPTAAGGGNVIIGQQAGTAITNNGDDNIFIGRLSGAGTNNLLNAVSIGTNAKVMNNDQMILGNNSINVGIGLSTDAAGPANKLEINTAALAAQPLLSNGNAGLGGGNATGLSGLRFRDLTSVSVPYATNPGLGVLSVDADGDVILVPGDGTPLGNLCGATTTNPLSADYEIPLGGNEFYFSGNTANTDKVLVGYSCTPARGKFNVFNNQQTNTTTTTTGIFSDNQATQAQNEGLVSRANGAGTVLNIGVHGIALNSNRVLAVWGQAGVSNGGASDGGLFQSLSVQNVPNRGVIGEADQSTLSNTGGEFKAQGNSSSGNVGVFATALGSSVSNIGINASAPTGAADYAGYFTGNVFITGNGFVNGGTPITSDIMFKTNLDTISNAMQIVDQLQPKTFYYDTTNTYNLKFSSKKQHGLIAQEVLSVLPELVGEVTKPADHDSLGNVLHPAVTYKTVNYNALFAIMLKGMQEQQSRIDQLESALGACCSSSSSRINNNSNVNQQDVELSDKNIIVLDQNVPNPFAEQTTISYNIPENTTTGQSQILFYDVNGKLIKAVDIKTKGRGQLNVFANDLSNGLYSYALVVDGKIIDTKKMLKTN